MSHGVRVPEYVAKLTRGGVARGEIVRAADRRSCRTAGPAWWSMAATAWGRSGRTSRWRARSSAPGRVRPSTTVAHRSPRGALALRAISRRAGHDRPGDDQRLPTMANVGRRRAPAGDQPARGRHPGGRGRPIVYDRLRAAAHGKLRVYQQRGPAPAGGVALDRAGRPTTDPGAGARRAAAADRRLQGQGRASADHGPALLDALRRELRHRTGHDGDRPGAGAGRHFVVAIRVAAFEEIGQFQGPRRRRDPAAHACRPAPDAERIYAPGEKEALTRRAYARDGIPLNAATLADLRRVAEELDLPADVPPARRGRRERAASAAAWRSCRRGMSWRGAAGRSICARASGRSDEPATPRGGGRGVQAPVVAMRSKRPA